MTPQTVTIAPPEDGGESTSAALESAAQSMAHAALAPSSLGYLGAHAIDSFDGPHGTVPCGAALRDGIVRAGAYGWLVVGREAFDALSMMGAHVCLSGHENEAGDAIDAAERRSAPDPGTGEGGAARDDDHDAYELAQVISGRELSGREAPLAALTSGPERDLGEADIIRDEHFEATRADMATGFLAAYAIDFGDGEECQ